MVFSWFRGVTLPPLVTTSPLGTTAGNAGILGQGTTSILFGGGQAEDNIRYGFRVGAGYWFGSERTLGVEAGVMLLGSQNTTFSTSSNVNPILARPYTDATNFTQQAALVAFPGFSNGSINIASTSGHFYSGNLDFDLKFVDDGWFRLTALAGYRYYRYDEGLSIQDTILPTSPIFVAGTQIASSDRFATRNIFHGLDLGVRPQFVWQSWTLDLLARVAVGNLHHTVDPGFAPVAQVGGVYALPTNIGRHGSSDWVVTPEVGANLGWRITPNVKVRVGYGLLYLNGVARAADQVNTAINPLHLPGLPPAGAPAAPTFYLNRTDLWIQNVNVGVEFTY